MTIEEFRKYAHELVDWMADYLNNIEQYPVKAFVAPGEVLHRIPNMPPETGEPFENIFADFIKIILPGMTHWQHPGFMGYFPANSSPPSVLAEMLTATLAAQCMLWQTSPAATELEERMMQWLAHLCGLPTHWHGVIQDTASSATLCALLTAREKYSAQRQMAINQYGFEGQPIFRIYASAESHSSVEKAVRIAGFGSNNLVKVPTDDNFSLKVELLEQQIKEDLQKGYQPLCVVATLGTTSSTGIDPIGPIGRLCQENHMWLHVDAAYAGTALMLPEYRYLAQELSYADSYVFNPHKWMLTNFDCSAYYVKDKEALLRTFEIMPEYLKTPLDRVVNNYRDWGIPLGRRFRALKLWFVLRTYGAENLRALLRHHINLAKQFASWLKADDRFELMAPVHFNLVCFRLKPKQGEDESFTEQRNEQLLNAINQTGHFFLTHTRLNGKYTLRAVFGQTYVKEKHVRALWHLISQLAL
ncbi:MAG: aminotransferase class I/II-fold pyridoxal phosphate-dependent enzyme [Cytophagales bacterium]|nr:aminotransferase class I/II-fold pyridoxal phosphate-dependent enzyme [Bernardetiaceae bacterium]MDW8209546.1 aminotransferase class I/II-fold pyridoxal phosphate-dependent enzyme [Cytophagales bacterium]